MTDILGPASQNAVTNRPARSISRAASNTWFKDCTDAVTEDGTVLPADFLNDTLAQLREAFTQSGIDANNADDMLWRAMRSAGLRYAVDTGSANSIECQFSPPVKALYPGLCLLVKVKAANTAGVLLTADTMNPKSVIRSTGEALVANDLKPNMILIVVYDGTSFQIVGGLAAGTGGGGGTGAALLTRLGYASYGACVDIDAFFEVYGASGTSSSPSLPHRLPTITDGTEILSLTVAPSKPANKLRVNFNGFSHSTSGYHIGCLFRNTTPIAMCFSSGITGSNWIQPMIIGPHEDAPGLASITYSVRVGHHSYTPGQFKLAMNGWSPTSGYGAYPYGNGVPVPGMLFAGAAKSILSVDEILEH